MLIIGNFNLLKKIHLMKTNRIITHFIEKVKQISDLIQVDSDFIRDRKYELSQSEEPFIMIDLSHREAQIDQSN